MAESIYNLLPKIKEETVLSALLSSYAGSFDWMEGRDAEGARVFR